MNAFKLIVEKDIRLALTQGGSAMWVIMFYLLTVTLFPLAVGPDPEILSRIASGVIWVAVLLAVLLSLDRLFKPDFEDGTLELLALAPIRMELVVIAKVLAHWVTTGLPLSIMAPIMGVLLSMDPNGYPALVVAMMLGTAVLSLIGAIGAALTMGIRRGGFLLSLLVLPFFVPALIFGVMAVDSTISGTMARPNFMILLALFLVSTALAPLATSAALKINLE